MRVNRVGAVSWVLIAVLSAGCTARQAEDPEKSSMEMNQVAESYVKLVLAVGGHDGDYVDAYYGPEAWKQEAESAPLSLAEIREQALELQDAVESRTPAADDEMLGLRRRYLSTQLQAMVSRVRLLEGAEMSFDQESKALYDAVAPTHGDEHYRKIVDELEPLLPGDGSLIERYDRFKQGFVIPKDRLDAVFQASIAACRERTVAYVDLPAEESFVIEYVTDKAWSGYNWYQGGFQSLIQVNTDLPIYIDRAIDLACHEGYPGHHVYNVLLEKHLVRDREWVEFSIYPLFSPQSLIAEGTANYGIDVAFPGNERAQFEREHLFPLAGLDASQAERYYEIADKVSALSYAGNEAARRYLNGEIDAAAAARQLTSLALMPPDRAEQRVRFIDKYRSYVINYNLGQDLVGRYVESQGGTADNPAQRWAIFASLLASPRLPSDL